MPRIKVNITGYYEVDMANAEEYYGTTDPEEMLAIDTKGLESILEFSEINDFLHDSRKVEISWEN